MRPAHLRCELLEIDDLESLSLFYSGLPEEERRSFYLVESSQARMSNLSCCWPKRDGSVVSHEGLPLAATAADGHETSYKVGVPKFRWISPGGQSVIVGVAVDCNGAEHLVVHTDQVSLR